VHAQQALLGEVLEVVRRELLPEALGRDHGGGQRPEGRKGKRSFYIVATDDRMIPPPAQHAMSKRAGSTVVEVKASRAVYESQPSAVDSVIARASRGER